MPADGPRFGHAVTRATSRASRGVRPPFTIRRIRPPEPTLTHRFPTPRRLLAAVALALLATTLGACSGSAPESPATSGAVSPVPTTSAVPPVETTVTVREVTGKLSHARKLQVKAAVKAVVDRYLDAAFFGTYPRRHFDKAFAVFTPGVRSQAKRDADLLTNARLGRRAQAVTARNRRVRLDVLAAKNHPVGVTARFAVGLRITNGAGRVHTERITGALSLTHQKAPGADTGRWRVFAYDVNRGDLS